MQFLHYSLFKYLELDARFRGSILPVWNRDASMFSWNIFVYFTILINRFVSDAIWQQFTVQRCVFSFQSFKTALTDFQVNSDEYIAFKMTDFGFWKACRLLHLVIVNFIQRGACKSSAVASVVSSVSVFDTRKFIFAYLLREKPILIKRLSETLITAQKSIADFLKGENIKPCGQTTFSSKNCGLVVRVW